MATDWSTLSKGQNPLLFDQRGGQSGFDSRAVAAGGAGFTKDNKSYYKVRDPLTGAEAWREGEPVNTGGGFLNSTAGRVLSGVATGGLSELAHPDSPYLKAGLGALGGFATGGLPGAVAGTVGQGVRMGLGGDQGNIGLRSALGDVGTGAAAGSLGRLFGGQGMSGMSLLSKLPGMFNTQNPQNTQNALLMARQRQLQQAQLQARLRALLMFRGINGRPMGI